MTKTPYEQLWDFQKSFGQPHTTVPGLPDQARRALRKNLLEEEYKEYLTGEENSDIVEIADALIDMVYIIYGTGVEYGLPMDDLFAEVHRSNMSKLDPETGKPIYREDGKILKPAGYSKPDLRTIIENAVLTSASDTLEGDDGEEACCGCGGCYEGDQDGPEETAPDEASGPASMMDDFYFARNSGRSYLVYIDVGTGSDWQTQARYESQVENFKAQVASVGGGGQYYYLPTTGGSRIERL